MKRTPLRRTSRKRAGISRTETLALDKLWQKIIRERANHVCQWGGCLEDRYLQCHHVYSRSIRATRWELDNGILLCRGHHFTVAHHRPLEFDKWWTARVGQAVADRLALKARIPSRADAAAMKLYLESELEKLEARRAG